MNEYSILWQLVVKVVEAVDRGSEREKRQKFN